MTAYETRRASTAGRYGPTTIVASSTLLIFADDSFEVSPAVGVELDVAGEDRVDAPLRSLSSTNATVSQSSGAIVWPIASREIRCRYARCRFRRRLEIAGLRSV